MEIDEVPGVQLEGERSSPMEHYKATGIKPVRHENRVDIILHTQNHSYSNLISSPQTINTFGVSGHANMVNIAGDHITNISNEKEKENGLSLSGLNLTLSILLISPFS